MAVDGLKNVKIYLDLIDGTETVHTSKREEQRKEDVTKRRGGTYRLVTSDFSANEFFFFFVWSGKCSPIGLVFSFSPDGKQLQPSQSFYISAGASKNRISGEIFHSTFVQIFNDYGSQFMKCFFLKISLSQTNQKSLTIQKY